ncbi:MAG: single-stranded-DNA-specific exonuclease RecJ [Reichenbachiella sp.]|uniref:single-stranded-DNA-specific exonuclease RecJ n=1 Tax=Reichenbachiella sp. TaxID=2184521 RepID=UPI00326656E3
MIKEWVVKIKPEVTKIEELQNQLNIHPILCALLIQRGIKNIEDAKSFFRPELDRLHDPFLMRDMDKAVERLTQAIFEEEKILIYGDYDVDGTTSVALAYNFLKDFSPNIFTYIPDRYTEGYGVSRKGIDWALDHDIKLLITLDCGIRATENIKVAADGGIDVIICDHHLPGEELPAAVAILDPKQNDCSYPYNELSGCGIGYKLLEGFSIQNGIDQNKLLGLLDLVAVSIASDIVPVTGENRLLAWFGLKKLNNSPLPGFAALIEKAGMNVPLTISDVVFGIGPRINAAGRIGHAKTALDLMTQSTKEEAYVYAEKLNVENQERKNYDENITIAALELIKTEGQEHKCSTVLFKKDWHKGVIGIVASRCIEQYYKPTIIMTESNGMITGSARSVQGFDVYLALERCSDHLIQFGGHKYAAGLTMEPDRINDFKVAFEEAVSELIEESQKKPTVNIDTEIDLQDIDFKMFGILKQMGPFGPMNMQPVFCSRNVFLKKDPRVLKEKHLKLFISQAGCANNFDVIGFGLGHFHDQLDAPFDIVYTIEENHYKGNTTLQLMLKDIRV